MIARAALAAGLLLAAAPALAQQQARRTASWYAAHPDTMARVLVICRDDPGHTWDNPDCMNARHAETLVAEREARAHAGDLTPPSSPLYWKRHPAERAMQLSYCSRMKPADRAAFFCDAAEAAGAYR